MDEVKIKKTRKKKVPLIASLISETTGVNSSATKPVCGGEEVVVRKISGEVIASVNPNAIATFAAEHKLDANACEVCVSKGPHVNHNGYTFQKVGGL